MTPATIFRHPAAKPDLPSRGLRITLPTHAPHSHPDADADGLWRGQACRGVAVICRALKYREPQDLKPLEGADRMPRHSPTSSNSW